MNVDDKIATVQVNYRDVCLMEAELFAMNNVKLSANAAAIQDTVAKESGSSGNAMSIIGIVCVVILGAAGAYIAVNNFRRAMARKQARRRRAARRRSR